MKFWSVLLFLSITLCAQSKAQSFSFAEENLLNIIKEFEDKTDIKFLYRESLVSNIELSLTGDYPDIFNRLTNELNKLSIGLKLDEKRNQALLYKSVTTVITSQLRLSGYILDNETGERLPYSTISWLQNGMITGTASTELGTFNTIIETQQDSISVLFSYAGYDPVTLGFRTSEKSIWQDLAIRLQPQPYAGNEIIVEGSHRINPSDSLLDGLVKIGTFSPLGESNAIRSLQTLPSVLTESALNDGLNVRGSPPDGFRVMLDGLTMYNQSHLFGLIDAMNADILKTSGFFYDITPAQFRAPHGGVLSLITKTGGLQKYSGNTGISNTAIHSTVEGPLLKGKASWLLSGRHSFIDQMNWLNNPSLIEYGLDLDRDYDFEDPNIRDIQRRNRNPVATSAAFYDAHGKIFFEQKNGAQITLSGYIGEDNASQNYTRIILNNELDFETSNNWSNKILSGSYNVKIGTSTISQSSVGFSDYFSNYLKTDARTFGRQTNNDNRQGVEVTISPLLLNNSLQEFNIQQNFYSSFRDYKLSYGFSYSDFEVTYREESAISNSFRSRRTSQLLDAFTQMDVSPTTDSEIQIGTRLHYFSNGKYLDFSPRIKIRFFPHSKVSASLGFSQSYQYLHRLDFYNINSTDFWIMSNEEQPPSSTKNYTANIRFQPSGNFLFQVEGYFKLFENLRIHGLNTQLISLTFNEDETPWYYQSNGEGKGLEFFMRQRISKIQLSATYTLSSIEIENQRLNDGKPFYPDWDRRHQFSLMSDFSISKKFNVYLVWNYATGNPARGFEVEAFEQDRLGEYSRIDLSASYKNYSENGTRFEAAFSVYNVFNRNNPWYSDIKQGRNTSTRTNEAAIITVYDLGFQPSFKFSVGF